MRTSRRWAPSGSATDCSCSAAAAAVVVPCPWPLLLAPSGHPSNNRLNGCLVSCFSEAHQQRRCSAKVCIHSGAAKCPSEKDFFYLFY